MRSAILILLTLATVAQARPRQFAISQTEQVTRGLVAYWSMRNSGTTVYDEKGGHNGTAVNGTALAYANGLVGTGALFDGGNDYVDATTGLATIGALTTGSVSLWFKTTDTGVQVMVGSYDTASATKYLRIYTVVNLVVMSVRESSELLTFSNGSATLADGNWHHVVFTVAAGGNACYIDGQSVTPSYSAGNAATRAFFGDVTGKDNLLIGCQIDSSGPVENPMNGYLDEVRIYNVALTADEVGRLYRMGATIFANR